MIRPSFYTEQEGGPWLWWQWPEFDLKDIMPADPGLVLVFPKPPCIMPLTLHSLRVPVYLTAMGKSVRTIQRWDCINGWTGSFYRTREWINEKVSSRDEGHKA